MSEETSSELQREQSGGFPVLAKVGIALVVSGMVYALLPDDPAVLSHEARITGAVGILMAVLWMTEAMPLAVTALLPIAIFPLAGIGSIGDVAALYANEIIFLFLGGFVIAAAMRQSGLHRRIALTIVHFVGVQPTRLVAGFMIATAFLSMWISNTAATLMLLPIGASIVALIEQRRGQRFEDDEPGPTSSQTARFAVSLMLGIAYAASIGSIATPIGTPPNLFMIGFLERNYGISIGFGQWMAFGLPIVLVMLPAAWYLLTGVMYRPGFQSIPGGKEIIDRERSKLGIVSQPERVVLTVFVSAVVAWILRDPVTSWEPLVSRAEWVGRLTDPGIAIIAAISLFLIPAEGRAGEPVMTWEATREIPWSILLLFGGGLSLAGAVTGTGLDRWIGEQLTVLTDLPLVVLILGITTVVIVLTELTSNTATAATFLPILAGLAVVSLLDPLLLVVPAALAGTCAFMLPVATPPNAIVFSSGHVTIPQMVRAGVLLNILAVFVIAAAVLLLGPLVLGIEL